MQRDIKNSNIDIVLPWVNGNDSEWKLERKKYEDPRYDEQALADYRFNDWELLKYWFRAIETCLPWFNKVFLITCGHFPDFLNKDCPKLKIIKHSDYIPNEFLPTFNSNTIEMNLFRIEDLSENFILFNDDLFPIVPFSEDYFFYNGKVCDEAIESVLIAKGTGLRTGLNTTWNNMTVINKNFDKRKCKAEHFDVWFSTNYGEDYLKRNFLMQYWDFFAGFTNKHMANSYKKSMFKKVYEKNKEALDAAFKNRFRGYNDLTHWLVRYWQLCEGDIHPRLTLGKSYRVFLENCEEIAQEIEAKKYPMVCINEFCTADEFTPMKQRMQKAFETLFPTPSSFENVWGGVQQYSIITSCRHSEPVGFALGETSPHYVSSYKEAA